MLPRTPQSTALMWRGVYFITICNIIIVSVKASPLLNTCLNPDPRPMCGPEPGIGLPMSTIVRALKAEAEKRHRLSWLSTEGLKHSKLFIGEVTTGATKYIWRNSRTRVRDVTGALTGHFATNEHLKKMGLTNDSTCRACGEDTESMEHLLCYCDVLATKRMNLLGNGYPIPEDYRHFPLSGIAALMHFRLWTVSAVLINMCAQGMLISYPSCLLPALRKPDSIIRPNSTTASWISSCVGLASIPGIIISAYLMSYRGRRLTHGLFIIPGLIGCILISQASCVTTLMIGRILGGFTNGATVSLGAVVIGEFTSPKHRGMFLNLKTAMICFGSMIIHSFGNFLHWKTVALTFVIPHVITILIVLTWPESPAWLASRKEFKKCEESFIWLRGKDENSLKELNQMIKAQTSAFNKDPYFQDDIKEFFRKFTKKDFLKPIGIFIVGGILLEASGRHIFLAYALDIVNEVTGDKSNSFYYTLGIDIIITASSILSSFLMRICPRRTLLFSTGFASVAVVSIVCGYLFLTSIGIITEAYPAIPMGLFVVYFILANLACSPMPLSFVGELFPLAHRGVGAMCCSIMMSVIMYVGLQITPSLLIAVKLYGTFTVFGVTIVLCLMILYFILPETKDRTLQEIEDYFNHGKFMDEADEEVELKMLSDGDLISEVRIVTARQFTT